MALLDLFSKRQKRSKGEVPDVFAYGVLPDALRVQIVHILTDALGEDNYRGSNHAKDLYKALHDMLAREYGLFNLGDTRDPRTDLVNFFLETGDVAVGLDWIEVAFRAVAIYGADPDYMYGTVRRVAPDEAIDELNARFREHGVGYSFSSGEIIRIDSQLIHAEAVKPALQAISQKQYATANEEFLRAHEHYRNGRHEEAITDALKSLESVLKVIAARRRWGAKDTDTAKPLLDLAFKNGLIPDYLQSEFAGLRSALESGVPTVRNRQAGHGQGTSPRRVPEYLTAYIMHLTASSLLFLVRADEELA